MKRAVVTGAGGFVGRSLCDALTQSGWHVTGVLRERRDGEPRVDRIVYAGDLAVYSDWDPLLAGVDCVIHLAARTHRMRERGRDVLAAYRRDNVDVTRRVAQAAATRGVRRFVFLSSVKAMGEERARPYSEGDAPRPSTPYGISKLESEQALEKLASTMEVVIVRPPLVYGPGGPGNVPRLARLARLGSMVPLPLASVTNRRSVIFIENLASLLIAVTDHPMAANSVFLVSDDESPSTIDLLRRIAEIQGTSFRAIGFPVGLLRFAARISGFGDEAARLLDTLVVDSTRVRRTLAWSPPFTLTDGLRATFGTQSAPIPDVPT